MRCRLHKDAEGYTQARSHVNTVDVTAPAVVRALDPGQGRNRSMRRAI